MSAGVLTALMFVSMVVLLLTGRQVFVIIGAIAFAAAFLLWRDGVYDLAFFSATRFVDWFMLIAVPMFIFMGLILGRSGVAGELFDMMYKWAGGLAGGLGIGTVGLCASIAAMSGTNAAATVAATTVALPSMLEKKYDKKMVTGVVQAGGALGFLIPPSVVFILYGMVARESIGHLWVAGILPGILLALMFIVYIGIRCRFNPSLGPPIPPEQRANWGEKFRALKSGILPIILVFCVLGLLFMGVITMMECGAVAAAGAMICAAIHRKLSWRVISESMTESLKTTSMIFWIVIASLLFSAVYDGLGARDLVANLLVTWGGGSRYVVIGIMMLSFMVLGMFMDDAAILFIIGPLYIPIIRELGFSTVWFGVLYVVNMQMAFLTPPYGFNLFIMKGLIPKDSGITITDMYWSVLPFIAIQATCLGLIVLFPQIALWLPSIVFSG